MSCSEYVLLIDSGSDLPISLLQRDGGVVIEAKHFHNQDDNGSEPRLYGGFTLEQLCKEGAILMPFHFIFDNIDRMDDRYQSLSPQEFFGAMRKGQQPMTSQIAYQDIDLVFRTFAEAGYGVVFPAFSSALSGMCDTAMMIRNQVIADYPEAEIYVIDCKIASIAEGLLDFEAMRQKEAGLSAAELAEWLDEAKYFVNEAFMVDNFDALRRGGRIPAAAALAGKTLDLKPLLSFSLDGALVTIGMARGRKKAMKSLVEYYQKRLDGDRFGDTFIIGHADCLKEAQRYQEMLCEADDSLVPVMTDIGTAIGSHVGPGMLAIAFWGPDRREDISVADKIAKKVKGTR